MIDIYRKITVIFLHSQVASSDELSERGNLNITFQKYWWIKLL